MLDGSYRGFWEAFKAAEAEMVDEQLDRVHRDASQKHGWTAAMTLLERRMTKDFGRNQQIDIKQDVRVLVAPLPALPEQQALALIQQKLASGRKLFPLPDSPE